MKKLLFILCLIFCSSVNSFAQRVSVSIIIDTGNFAFINKEPGDSLRGKATAWKKRLEANLDPSVIEKNHPHAGVYLVVVRFIMDNEESVSDIQSETSNGYGMEQGVIKAIKGRPVWMPSQQFRKSVIKAYCKLAVTFVVSKK